MRVVRCWKCLWLNPKTQEHHPCLSCGYGTLGHTIDKSLSEYKHQPDWYMEQKSKGTDEMELQKKLDDWMLEILL